MKETRLDLSLVFVVSGLDESLPVLLLDMDHKLKQADIKSEILILGNDYENNPPSVLSKLNNILNLRFVDNNNLGKEESIQKGIQKIDGRYSLVCSSFEDVDANDVLGLFDYASKNENEADIIIGERKTALTLRHKISGLFNKLLLKDISDHYSPFLCFNEKAIAWLKETSCARDAIHLLVEANDNNLKIKEIAVCSGICNSRLSLKDAFKISLVALRLKLAKIGHLLKEKLLVLFHKIFKGKD